MYLFRKKILYHRSASFTLSSHSGCNFEMRIYIKKYLFTYHLNHFTDHQEYVDRKDHSLGNAILEHCSLTVGCDPQVDHEISLVHSDPDVLKT